MQTGTEADIFEFHDWVVRYRPAQGLPARLLVMLHGWTGDENSMWIFTQVVPSHIAVVAPRAPIKAPEGGYTWRGVEPGTWGLPGIEDLRPSAIQLLDFVDGWMQSSGLNARQFDLMGFSQGAALSYVFTLLYPTRIRMLAALSGFLPRGSDVLLEKQQLAGKPVFISHGRQDEMVSVEQARKAGRLLAGAGAQVSYCETEGGHKVSRDCMKGLKSFYLDRDG